MSVELVCYVKTIIVFTGSTTSLVFGILWWTDRITIIYSNLSNKATFKTYVEWILLTENISSPELTPFDAVVK